MRPAPAGRPFRLLAPAARRRALALAAVVVALVPVAPPATADPQAQRPRADVELLHQPAWHSRKDALDIVLRVSNPGPATLDGFFVQISAHPEISTRYELGASLDGDPGFQASVVTKEFGKERLEPGATSQVRLAEPVASLESITAAEEGGVFPLSLTVYDRGGSVALASVTTALLYYPRRPQTPLNLVTVVPLNDLAARGPDRIFYSDEDGRWPLEEALEEGGWLSSLLAALESQAKKGFRVAVAPSPRLLEEVADMSDGYRRGRGEDVQRVEAPAASVRDARDFLKRLRDVVRLPNVQPLLVPYASPDLPALMRSSGRFEPVPIQISAGESVLTSVLGRRFQRNWLWAPAGRLDAATLEQLRLAGAAERTFFSEESLEQATDPALAGCPESSPTFACPALVGTDQGSTLGYVAEPVVQERFGALAADDSALALQKLLAETAMVHAELPGKPRILHVALPSLWRPSPSSSVGLLRALAGAPWLSSVTPDEGLAKGLEPARREILNELPLGRREPREDYYEEVDAAERMLDFFGSIKPPPQLFETLRANVLVAQSRDWWSDRILLERGLDYARAAEAEARRELNKIGLGVPAEVTLTSQRGKIQISVFNETGYPVQLQLTLNSPKLALDRPVIKKTFAGPGEQVPVRVTARSSGIFPLEVEIQTPEGHRIEGPKPVLIRSTSFNDIALMITLGALAFLVFFYLQGVLRRRRAATRGRKPRAPAT